MNALNRFADPIFCIARLIIGLMYACHGGQKILGFPPGGHGPPTEMMGWVAGWIELAGGLLIAFGFLARLAAFFAAIVKGALTSRERCGNQGGLLLATGGNV